MEIRQRTGTCPDITDSFHTVDLKHLVKRFLLKPAPALPTFPGGGQSIFPSTNVALCSRRMENRATRIPTPRLHNIVLARPSLFTSYSQNHTRSSVQHVHDHLWISYHRCLPRLQLSQSAVLLFSPHARSPYGVFRSDRSYWGGTRRTPLTGISWPTWQILENLKRQRL